MLYAITLPAPFDRTQHSFNDTLLFCMTVTWWSLGARRMGADPLSSNIAKIRTWMIEAKSALTERSHGFCGGWSKNKSECVPSKNLPGCGTSWAKPHFGDGRFNRNHLLQTGQRARRCDSRLISRTSSRGRNGHRTSQISIRRTTACGPFRRSSSVLLLHEWTNCLQMACGPSPRTSPGVWSPHARKRRSFQVRLKIMLPNVYAVVIYALFCWAVRRFIVIIKILHVFT